MSASLHPVAGDPREVLQLIRTWVTGGGPPMVVRTSGSTGQPKHIRLSREAMVASATAAIERLGGPGGWQLAIPVSGVGGLQVLVRSVLAGVDPVVSDVIDPKEVGGDRRYISIVPTQMHRLAAANRLVDLAAFDAVLLGGAAASPTLLAAAAEAGVHIVRTYGMTETCGGCVYDGTPLPGVSMRIVEGQVELTGPILADELDLTADGWFPTGDLGEISGAGVLSITGRIDDVVQSGAVKVALPAVTEAIRQLPGIRDAVVLARTDAEWGSRVVAFIVSDGDVMLDRLRDDLEAAGLDRRWAPKELVRLDRLPLLPNGKVDRQQLVGQDEATTLS